MLRITGTNFDVDLFIKNTGLKYSNKFYKGQRRLKTKPNREKIKMSGLNANVSNAEFDDDDQQIADAIAYLKTNKEKLNTITSTKGIEFAVIDFGVEYPDDTLFVRNFYFKPELIQLCGELGLAIELSVYREASASV